MTATDPAQLLTDFVDVLLPGGDGWPSASTAGIQQVLSQRLVIDRSPDSLDQLAAALMRAGGPLAGRDQAEQVAIVMKFETDEPDLFNWVRDAAFITYYESPSVVAAINAKGRPYLLRPHLTGYPTTPFDLERNTPRHGRGRYTANDAIVPLDIAGLGLDQDHTAQWGLKR